MIKINHSPGKCDIYFFKVRIKVNLYASVDLKAVNKKI